MKPIIKKFLIAIGIALLGIISTLSCLPTFFSTEYGKSKLLSWYNKKTNQLLTVDRISLNWFSSQELDGIKVVDQNGEEIFSCPRIQIESSLWKMLIWEQDMGEVVITTPKTTLLLPSEKETSLNSYSKKSEKIFILPLKGNIHIKDGSLTIPSLSIAFTTVFVDLSIPQGYTPIGITIKAETVQNGKTGNFAIQIDAVDSFKSTRTIHAEMQASHLPVKGIDAMIAVVKPEMKGFFAGALGNDLDLQLSSSIAKNRMELELTLNSPNLHTSFTTKASDNLAILAAPTRIDLTLTPEFFAGLSKRLSFLEKYSLQEPSQIAIDIKSFSLPFSPEIDYKKMGIDASVSLSPSSFLLGSNNAPLFLQETTVKISSANLSDQLEIGCNSSLTYRQTNSSLQVSSTLGNLFDQKQGSVSFQVIQFPLDLIDPSISSILGQNISLQGSANLDEKGGNGELSIKTPLFSVEKAPFLIDQQKLQTASTFQMTYEPGKDSFSFLTSSSPVYGKVSSLEIPFSSIEKMKMSATLSADEVVFSESLPLEKSQASAQLEVNNLDNINLSVTTKQLSLTSQSSLLLSQKLLRCNKASFVLTLQPSEFAALTHFETLLQSPLTARGEISSFVLPFGNSEYPLQDFTIKAGVDTLSIQDITLSKASLNISFLAKANKLSFQLDSQTKTGQESGSLSWNGEVVPFNIKDPTNFEGSQINTSLSCKNLSVALFGDLFGMPTLVNAVGNTINAQGSMVSQGQNQQIDLMLKSANAQIDGLLKIEGNRLSIQKRPLCITLNLNKDGYLLLVKLLEPKTTPSFVLQENGLITLCLSDLSCNWMKSNEKFSIDWNSLNYKSKLDIDKLSFSSKQDETVFIKSVQVLSNKSIQDERFYVQMQGLSGARSSKISQEGNFVVNGNLINQKKGSWNINALKTNFQVSFKQFPSILLDIISSNQQGCLFTSLFGNTFNLNGDATLDNLTGPVSLNLNSPYIRVSVNGDMKTGTLSLKETLVAQLQLTPNLSQCFLKDTKISSIYSNNPVSIAIDPKEFSFPVYPFDKSKINAPNLRIELGQVYCENRGNAGTVLKILKSSSKGKTIKLWFAPLDSHIRSGVCDIERTEILINDTFQIATWGQVDLPGDYVDMVLGLTAQALQAAFGITKLPENYVMQIPMKGPLGDVEINTSAATTKIAALLAWQHGESLAGKGGALFGGFLGALATLPDKDAKVPPPKRPFPWEDLTTPQKKQKNHKKKSKAIHKTDKPLKQLWKVLN